MQNDHDAALLRHTLLARWPLLGDLALAAIYLLFAWISLGAVWRGDLGALLLMLQELLIVVLALRRAPVRDPADDAAPAVLGWCGTLLPLLLRPHQSGVLALTLLGGAIQLTGGLVALAATRQLGRSFGIAAANRGVQSGGLYRYVRHPIYAAYLLVFGGFTLAHPSMGNALILLVWLGVQLLRIQAEERLLMRDAHYILYAAQVRYRLIPGGW